MIKLRDSVYKKRGIYGIRNKINNKTYIGKTQVSFGDRWDSHKVKLRKNYHDNAHLQRAWNKYGEENFEFFIIEECSEQDSLETYNKLEKKHIKYYKEQGLAYNMSDGGDGAAGQSFLTPEGRQKIAEVNRQLNLGKKASKETREKMSRSQRGRKHTPESIAKMKEIHKGKIILPETREKISKTLQENPTNQKYSKETIINIRIDSEQHHMTNREIADKYHMSISYIRRIVNYERWKNLKPPIN